jgi:small subunit ribosomal protein S6
MLRTAAFPLSYRGQCMVRYELLMLAVPEITKDETAELEKQLERVAKKAEARLSSFERWGKYRLAYPVRKNEYGIYFLIRFEVAEASNFLTDIRSLLDLKFNALIMRYLLTKLPKDAALTYIRPESLEEAPTQDVSSFLRKNKMEGLLSSVPSSKLDKPEPMVTNGGVDHELVDEHDILEG